MNHSSRNPLTPIPISSSLSSADNDSHGRLTSPIHHTSLAASPLQTSPPFSKTLNIQRPRIPPNFGSHSLRDYPLNNYDRQLTVEKATFDPVSYLPSQPQQTSSLNVPSNISTSTTGSTINNQEPPITFYRRSPPSAAILSPSLPLHLQLQDDVPLPSSSSSSSSKIPEKSLPSATKRKDTPFAHSPPLFMKPPPAPKVTPPPSPPEM